MTENYLQWFERSKHGDIYFLDRHIQSSFIVITRILDSTNKRIELHHDRHDGFHYYNHMTFYGSIYLDLNLFKPTLYQDDLIKQIGEDSEMHPCGFISHT